ncbi:MAG TPA: lipopolysaccharide kinase InaA family protein [Gemmataceae bacterium]|nr:lipopolysaccharide kinase InaA family protein [Gemmataceae bacterium]
MEFLNVNPRYQNCLQQQGLDTPAAFLDMPAIIICGHPDRNVARVGLGSGPAEVTAFLKCEHRVAWKDRLLNALAGFGFVSKSSREAAVLRSLQPAGIGCPDWIAVGEDREGRAFLLVREVTETMELRSFLHQQRQAPATERRRIARNLGEALAKLHNSGFDHPDLYSKHVLIRPGEGTVHFLDWQRTRRRHSLSWRRRSRNLAALEATLAEDLATVHERLVCLAAYLRKSRSRGRAAIPTLRRAARRITRLATRLLGQRRIREMRQLPATNHVPELIWQDGEALCLTRPFQMELAGVIPDWLRLANPPGERDNWGTRTRVDLPTGRSALLIRRRRSSFLGYHWSLIRRQRPTSPELLRAGQILRLERYGIRTWKLLAFGQRAGVWPAIDSFLLIEPPLPAVPLGEWLARPTVEPVSFRHMIREAAALLRRLHDLHYDLGGQPSFAVIPTTEGRAGSIVLTGIEQLHGRRRADHTAAWKDLKALHREISSGTGERTNGMRLLMSYLGLQRMNAAAKRMAKTLIPRKDSRSVARPLAEPTLFGRIRLQAADQGTLPR